MATLTVWIFDTADGADAAVASLEVMKGDALATVLDAAVVSWPPRKKKPDTRQLNELTGAGAVGGAFWGLLFALIFFMPSLGAAIGAATGALGGAMADVGIDDVFVSSVRGKVQPGTSALFLMSAGTIGDELVEMLESTDADLVRSNLPAADEERLREVFADN